MRKKRKVIGISFLLFALCLPFLCGPVLFRALRSKTPSDIVLLGDSILGQERGADSVSVLLEQRTGRTVRNGALGGTCMARLNVEGRGDDTRDFYSFDALSTAVCLQDFRLQKMVRERTHGMDYFAQTIATLDTVDFAQVEVLILNHGINDYHAGIPIDNPSDPYDPYTYAGALRSGIGRLRQTYPNLRIVLLTPTYSWYNKEQDDRLYPGATQDLGGGTLSDYVEKEYELAKELSVELLDVFHDFYPDEQPNDCWVYTLDGVHPNEAGRARLAAAIADFLQEK